MNGATPALQEAIEKAQAGAKERDAQAEKIIWANVLVNAGLGLAPVMINVFTFVGLNAATIIAVGHVYGYTINREQAGSLIKQILMSVGMTWGIGVLSWKLVVEIIKVAGITTLGAATATAMTVDAVLLGALSYALGYTAMTYFKAGCQLDHKIMRETFRQTFDEGKSKVKQSVKDKVGL